MWMSLSRPAFALLAACALIAPVASPEPAAAAPSPAEQQRLHLAAIADTFDLHNAERKSRGLAPLVYSPTLAVTYTQPYNDTLAAAESGLVHNDLGELFWPGTTTVAENLGMASGSSATPSAMTTMWMNSSGHRANLLNPRFSHIAIGWSVSAKGMHYVTVNFWGGTPEDVGTTYRNGSELKAGSAASAPPANTEPQVDVYTTPGRHNVNGREWRTTCEPYSQTFRCRTEIKATQVSYKKGRFVSTTDWVFNNLTYASSPRNLWTHNPLAAYGRVGGTAEWTSSEGRQWRTECDTPVTGQGGCRSYVRARVIESYRTSSGGTSYRWVTKWVLNNMVRF